MINPLKPAIQQWYRHLDKGQMFQVIAVDADEGWIEIQSFDGDVEELADEEWRALEIEACEPPEDWTGPYDDVEPDELGYSETGAAAQDWHAPVEGVPPTSEAFEETTPEDERDEWDARQSKEPYVKEQGTAKQPPR